jgi:hypothetical protein
MQNEQPPGLSADDLAAEDAVALPDKEVVSILDLNADLDLAIDAAAPIDLAVAANANVAAPIDAAVGANVLSEGSSAQALSDQGVMIDQGISADAAANATQDSVLDQGAAPEPDGATVLPAGDPATAGTTSDAGLVGGGIPDAGLTDGGLTDGGLPDAELPDGGLPDTGDVGTAVGGLADGNLLNVNVDLDGDANIAAPINGAVAANANVAAPIDAAVAANVGSIDSDAVAVSQQDAIINQTIDGSADANSDQVSDISQPDQP